MKNDIYNLASFKDVDNEKSTVRVQRKCCQVANG